MSQIISSSLFVLIYLVKTLFADSVCGEWQTFKDEKCFKVFDVFASYDEAINTCNQYNATTITITSLEKQKFIESYLFTTLKIADNVWTGLKYNNSKYKWINDFEANFTNWAEHSPINRSDLCVEINSDEVLYGKWSEVSCTKRNVVMCQRLPTITIQMLQNMLINNRNRLENNINQQNITNKMLEETTKKLITTVNELNEKTMQLENNIIHQNTTNQMLEETNKILNNTMNMLIKTVNELTVSKNQFDFYYSNKWIQFQTFAENNTRKAFIYPNKTQPYVIRSAALEICKQNNASLVDIESQEKEILVESFLNKINPLTEHPHYWLGGYDFANDYTYKWLNSGNGLTYTNWYTGYPKFNEPYIYIYYNSANNDLYKKWLTTTSVGTVNVFCEVTFH